MAWVAVSFLDFTVQSVRPSLSLFMPCVISAFDKHSEIIVPDRDIYLLLKRARNLFAFYRSLVQSSYFTECDIDTQQAAGEHARDPRGVRPRKDSHNHCLPHLLHFPLRSVTLPGSASAKSPSPATRDATSGQGAPAAESGTYAMGV